MKRKQNQAIRVIVILCVVLVLIIGVLIALLVISNRGKPKETAPTVPSVEAVVELPTETTPITEPPVIEIVSDEIQTQKPADLMVSTPYCNLYYPGELKDHVRATLEETEVGCIVKFYGTTENTEEHIFSIFFAETGENSFPIGMFADENATVDISVELCDISDVEELYLLQEGANYLLDKLKENPVFTENISDRPPETTEEQGKQNDQVLADLIVSTPYCDLYYPAQWKDSIKTTEKQLEFGYVVAFYCIINDKTANLFTVYFAEASENSFPIGILTVDDMDIDVSIELPEITEDEQWSEDEQALFGKLQEKSNYLMDQLKQLKNFMPVES